LTYFDQYVFPAKPGRRATYLSNVLVPLIDTNYWKINKQSFCCLTETFLLLPTSICEQIAGGVLKMERRKTNYNLCIFTAEPR